MSNVITIMGNLGQDPEERFTQDGQKIISFSVASNRRRGGQDETTWFRVTVFGNRFDKMMPYVKKGSSLVVVGEFYAREYTDRDGNKRQSLEVVADRISFNPFGRKEGNEQGGQSQGYSNQGPSQGTNTNYGQQQQQQNPGFDNPTNQGFGQPQANYTQQPQQPQMGFGTSTETTSESFPPVGQNPGFGEPSSDPFAAAGAAPAQAGTAQEDNLPF